MKPYDVIVVGAGAAGLMAAGRAAELGGKVLVLEKMKQAGRKLLITGKGRCNITNDDQIDEFIRHIHPDGRFLRNSFSKFFSADMIHLLERYGVETVMERGGRYFPASNKSSDVLNALMNWLNHHHAEIMQGEKARKLLITDQKIQGVETNKGIFYSENVILATGGKSYPATGSTGDGYKMITSTGHQLTDIRPALVPLETEGDMAGELQGLTLKNVMARVFVNNKKKWEAFGELLFTHFGLSGPIILTLSRNIVDELRMKKNVSISIDLKPALDENKLDQRLLRDLNEHGKKRIENIFRSWLPMKMIPVFLQLSGIDPEKEGHQVSSKERKKIRSLLKNLVFSISGHRGYKEAIITAGGIPMNEIFPKSMESKFIKGLYFAGEIINLDGDTGGYNLQIAFSTGWLAGDSCMQNINVQ